MESQGSAYLVIPLCRSASVLTLAYQLCFATASFDCIFFVFLCYFLYFVSSLCKRIFCVYKVIYFDEPGDDLLM